MPDEPGFVQIIHPSNGSVATVPESSLYQWHAAGWRRLAEDDVPPVEETPPPPPMTRAQAARASKSEEK